MTMSLSFEPLPSIYRSKQEFLASLPPWRRLLQRLNWRPTIDVDVERYAIEQEIKRLDEINARRARDVITLLEEYGGI